MKLAVKLSKPLSVIIRTIKSILITFWLINCSILSNFAWAFIVVTICFLYYAQQIFLYYAQQIIYLTIIKNHTQIHILTIDCLGESIPGFKGLLSQLYHKIIYYPGEQCFIFQDTQVLETC